jgi:3-oxoadipate enol-lactonase
MSAPPVPLHHEISGPAEAPPLLLSGSLGTTLEMWEPQLPALAERLRVVRFDHRGHGRSPAPPGPYSIAAMGRDVLGLLDRLGIERASFCGLSIGGMVGIWLAANAPGRIEHLVVICSSAHLPPAEAWRARARAVRAAGTVAAVADGVAARWLTPAFAAGRPEVAARLRAMLAASPPAGYAACCEAIADMDLRAELPRIAAPALVVGGVEDEAIPPAHAQAIAAGVPSARLRLLSPMAHLGSVEQAACVTELIADHVTGSEER